MLSKPHTNNKGMLYIVATPLGNMEDITLRALDVLKRVKIVAAEDTRRGALLFSYHNIKTPLISCHEHNEKLKTEILIKKLNNGEDIAFITDAGTPLVSDPGYILINEAISENIKIVPIPGASAVTSSLSASGIFNDSFLFAGFLSKKTEKRISALKRLAYYEETIIFFEAPNRVVSLIEDIIKIMGDRKAALARELTKPYEEFIRGSLSDIKTELLKKDKIKGECTLLISGMRDNKNYDKNEILEDIKEDLKENDDKLSDFAKKIAKKYSIPKNKAYEYALNVQKQMNL